MVAVIPATTHIPPIMRIMHLMLAATRAGTLDVIVVAAVVIDL